LVEHALYVDANQGARILCELFDDAHSEQRVPVLDQLITLAIEHQTQLEWDAWFQVGIRYATILTDRGKYSDAGNVLGDIMQNKNLSLSQRIETLVKRGNVRVRLWQKEPIQGGLDDFHEAIRLARENDLSAELGQAELEVGWAYSNIGNWEKANQHFQEALELALETRNQKLEAIVLNELAYIRFYEDPNAAISLCHEATKIWMELGDGPGLGRAYSNMGTILYRAADYDEAQKYFQRARDIFEPAKDQEWISIVSSWQGITCYAQAERSINDPKANELLREAENLVARAIEVDVHRERARNFNRMARIWGAQGRYDEAWRQLWKAYEASIEIPDLIYEAASLRDLSSMALALEKFNLYDDLKAKLTEYEARARPPYSLAYGGALLNMGIMGIYLGEDEFGFKSIAHGLQHSAESGRYGNHTLARTLEMFQKHVEEFVAPSDRRELGDYLIRYWDNEGLNRKYIEATRVFHRL
jgi:tetratricopeptide (TPR) repeat protein